MLNIPKVSKPILKTLEKKGWTLETLANARTEDLTAIQGVGPTTAWRIIVEARRQIRTARAEEPINIDKRWLTPSPEPPPQGVYVAPPPKPEPPWLKDMPVADMETKYLELEPDGKVPEMSLRIKRNWLRNRLIELS